MLSEWRLLYDEIHEARHHFAVEEALARLVDEGHTPPTLRMRQVYPSVFVGVYQDTWAEIDVDYCQTNNIQIVRRANGGGAVYQEMGSFCFSAFFRRDIFPQSDEELYRLFAIPVIQTCSDYGVVANFQGRNDLLVGERKIYGSAQLSWYNAFVQSGTFLVNMNFEVMARALTPSSLKFTGKPARSIQERVTSLSLEAGRELETPEVMDHFAKNIATTLGIQLARGELSPEEQELASKLLSIKYNTEEWNLGTQRDYQVIVADRSEEGVISLSADMKGEIIQKIRLTGDLLLSDQSGLKNLELALTVCSIQNAKDIVDAAPLSTNIRETLFRLLSKLTEEAATLSPKYNKENET